MASRLNASPPRVRAVSPADAEAVARLFRSAPEAGRGWSASSVENALAAGGFGRWIGDEPILAAGLVTPAGDDFELANLAVAAGSRRLGLGRALVEGLLEAAALACAERVVFEVAADSAAAIALYRGLAFQEIGRRRGYYRRGGANTDAIVMARALKACE